MKQNGSTFSRCDNRSDWDFRPREGWENGEREADYLTVSIMGFSTSDFHHFHIGHNSCNSQTGESSSILL